MRRVETQGLSYWGPVIFIAIVLLTLYYLWNVLVIFIIAAFLAFILHPVVELLDRRLPRPVSILIVFLVLAAILIGAGILLVPLIVLQFNEFVNSLPQLVSQGKEMVERLHSRYFPHPAAWQSIADRTLEQLQIFADLLTRRAIPAMLQVITGLVALLIVPMLTFFMLLDYKGYGKMILTLAPGHSRRSVTDLLKRLDEALWAFIRGEFVLMLAVGLTTGIGLYFVGAPYPVVFGVMAALLEVVPTIGPTVTFIVVTLVALLISPILALKAGAVCAGVQLLENALLVPVVMATAVKMDPVTVLLAIFIAGSLAGPLGVLVAIPLAVMIKVVLLYYYADAASPKP